MICVSHHECGFVSKCKQMNLQKLPGPLMRFCSADDRTIVFLGTRLDVAWFVLARRLGPNALVRATPENSSK